MALLLLVKGKGLLVCALAHKILLIRLRQLTMLSLLLLKSL